MSDEQRLICPGCGEDAVPEPPEDLTPWEAHGLVVPEWSHRDRTSLCPVIGPAGYEPAQPQPPDAQAGTEVPRLVPPEPGRQAGRDEPGRAVGAAGVIGRGYLAGVIARLGDPRTPNLPGPEAEREPEAGG